MKHFDVYSRNGKERKAVKRGWSWPALLFGSLWALCMQLWLIGILLLPVELLLQMSGSTLQQIQINSTGSYAETLTMVGGVIVMLSLGIRIIFGHFGNSWKRKRLERVGYSCEESVQANSKREAVSLLTDNSTRPISQSERG